jgi:septum formation protein
VRLILASASPRRAELLRAAGIHFDVLPADVDESVLPGETAEDHVRRLAEAKACAVLPRAGGRPVLSADTVVVVGGAILGKPADDGDARGMLRMLSGRSHEVITGVCLVRGEGGRGKGDRGKGEGKATTSPFPLPASPFPLPASPFCEVAVTTVEFAPLTDTEIEWYVAAAESRDKAGAYAIQGLASRFVTRIGGSYSNVVGLPVEVVYRMCKRAGLLIS